VTPRPQIRVSTLLNTGGETVTHLIDKEELPHSGIAHRF
jgi:hypothetical protein